MLENEPEGGERTGAEPAEATATSSTESTPEATKPARKRTSRRKTAPLNQPEQTEAPVDAAAGAGAPSAESPQAEVFAPVAGELEVAPKTTRRRRKATPAKAEAEPLAATDAEAAGAEVVPPVKVTRTRRRKATSPPAEIPLEESATEAPAEAAVEPHAVAEPQADVEGAEPSAEVSAQPAGEDAEGEDAEGEPTPEESGARADEQLPLDEATLARAGGLADRTGEVSPGAAVPADTEEPASLPDLGRSHHRCLTATPIGCLVLAAMPHP
ncbi:ribonuclease E/G, partial [Micromonospora sp. NPDC003776]